MYLSSPTGRQLKREGRESSEGMREVQGKEGWNQSQRGLGSRSGSSSLRATSLGKSDLLASLFLPVLTSGNFETLIRR